MRIDRARSKRRAIGLTSLIDVIFLLLLFFMLASTFSRFQALPLAGGGSTAATAVAQRPALLRVHGDGRMDLNGRTLQADALGEALAELGAREVARVAIWSGAQANVQDVVMAMDAIEKAGLAAVLVAGR